MKTKTFKLIALVALAGLIMVSCKKSSDSNSNSNGVGPSSTYYIKFTAGGNAMTYNYIPLGTVVDTIVYNGVNTYYGYAQLEAFNADTIAGTNYAAAFLAVYNDSTSLNTSTTYTTDSSANNFVEFGYGNVAGTVDEETDNLANPSFKVNFSSITSTTVQGTFSGNVGDSTGNNVTAITNGSFYMPINQ